MVGLGLIGCNLNRRFETLREQGRQERSKLRGYIWLLGEMMNAFIVRLNFLSEIGIIVVYGVVKT